MDYIVVGLGNPGIKYENTRHNAGFLAIDEFARSNNVKIDRLKFKALSEKVVISGKQVLLLKPQTFMNLSGESVREAVDFYKVDPQNVIVLVDDVSLDVGKMRIRRKGSHGGQNGLKNISLHLSTDDYPRIKIGVSAKPHKDYDLADWVLSNFSKDDKKLIDEICKNTADAIEIIIKNGFDAAMAKYN